MLIELNKEKIDQNLIKKIKKFYFGEEKDDKLLLNYYEVFYLIEEEKENFLEKKLQKKVLDFINENYCIYLVFKDLIKKNFIVKSGLKYGSHFRIYLKKDYENKEHSKYLVIVLNSFENIKTNFLISLFRISHSVKKRVILSFVDSEGDIIYYECKWLRI